MKYAYPLLFNSRHVGASYSMRIFASHTTSMDWFTRDALVMRLSPFHPVSHPRILIKDSIDNYLWTT